MSDLFCDDDFELAAAGNVRNASPIESVRQEIGRLAEESGWVAAPVTLGLVARIQAATLTLLRQHPDVTAPGDVVVVQTADDTYISASFDGETVEVGL